MSYIGAFAVNYARYYWNRVCHDGHIATKGGYPKTINNVALTPGMAFSDIGAIDGEEDCTHFLSCCVGNGMGIIRAETAYGTVPIPMFPGGGLTISSPFGGIRGLRRDLDAESGAGFEETWSQGGWTRISSETILRKCHQESTAGGCPCVCQQRQYPEIRAHLPDRCPRREDCMSYTSQVRPRL